MGCPGDKILSIALTAVICYQTWYNLGGAMELGGPYMEWRALAYSIGSLIPAIFLAIHNTKMAFAKNDEDKEALAADKKYKYACYFYLAILGGMALFRVFMHF